MLNADPNDFQPLPDDQFEEGFIADERLVAQLFGDDSQRERIDVLLAPFIAPRHRRKPITPLLIPAQLDHAGTLTPHGRLRPWVPQAILEPNATEDVILGDAAQADLFEGKLDNAEWEEVVQYGYDLLAHVGGAEWPKLLLAQGVRMGQQGVIMPLGSPRSYNINVQRVYEEILRQEIVPPLLEEYVSPQPLTTHHSPLTTSAWGEYAHWHVGSVSAEFPLSPSQRVALMNFLTLEEHSVCAINGPPGTGKTTLLQSVVATLWTQAAIDGGDPPLIVVTSTNNQAVTNVIDSFAKLTSVERWLPVDSFGLYLTNTKAKQTRASEQGILWANKRGKGFPATVEIPDLVAYHTPRFLERAANYFQTPIDNLDIAIDTLHEALTAAHRALSTATSLAYTLAAHHNETDTATLRTQLAAVRRRLDRYARVAEDWVAYQKREPLRFRFQRGDSTERIRRNAHFASTRLPQFSAEPTSDNISNYMQYWIDQLAADEAQLAETLYDLEEMQGDYTHLLAEWEAWREQFGAPDFELHDLLAQETTTHPLLDWLDTTLRHQLFTLATHYWEARWLQAMHIKGRQKDGKHYAAQLHRWQRYAMLTPCFVATMQSGPGFFEYTEQNVTEPLFNTLDLLVVDEAGQVVPEVSGGMIALARQALIVGDTQQIRPIHNIPRQQDTDTLLAAAVIRNAEQADDPRIRALAASRGSVMQMAHNRAAVRPEHGDPGLFLAEHRRSVPEIIAYCNWLAYEGKLRPIRPSIQNYPFPHLGYLHVDGDSEKAGSSRRNQHEAAVIAYWLAQNRSLIEQYYDAQLTDIVGIITPFAAQRQTLNAALSGQRLKIDTVGTIHALQGGERPIIIFSPVYSEPVRTPLFFDQNVNMLNVAVSRARDSFLVMGDVGVFDPESETPSGLLARFLFSAETNRLSQ